MRCPICRKVFSADDPNAALPFCSTRCKTIDLGKWLGEEYSIDVPNIDKIEEEIAGIESETFNDGKEQTQE